MSQLLVTILAIALVAALAGASLFYGGDVFTSGSSKATVATLGSQGQQISAAWTMYSANNGGANPSAIGDLSPTYLSSIPPTPTLTGATAWSLDATNKLAQVYLGTAAKEVCEQVAKTAGGAAAAPTVVATVTGAVTGIADAAAALNARPYNCIIPAANDYSHAWFIFGH